MNLKMNLGSSVSLDDKSDLIQIWFKMKTIFTVLHNFDLGYIFDFCCIEHQLCTKSSFYMILYLYYLRHIHFCRNRVAVLFLWLYLPTFGSRSNTHCRIHVYYLAELRFHDRMNNKDIIRCCVAEGEGGDGRIPPTLVFIRVTMMTSTNGNNFRVTGPLCGEFTGPGEFPTQKPVKRSFDVSFDLRMNKRLCKQSWGWWFETISWSLWRHGNDHTSAMVSRIPYNSTVSAE